MYVRENVTLGINNILGIITTYCSVFAEVLKVKLSPPLNILQILDST